MNAVAVVIVPLGDVLEEIGLTEQKIASAVYKIMEQIAEESGDEPLELEGITNYISDDDLLEYALKSAKVDMNKFGEVTSKLSSENHDLPVYIAI